MTDTPRANLPGSDAPGLPPSDVDPRFDDAAVGTSPPRPDPAEAATSARQQFAELSAACSEWVRGKPLQALAVAAGVGFLLGRSGR